MSRGVDRVPRLTSREHAMSGPSLRGRAGRIIRSSGHASADVGIPVSLFRLARYLPLTHSHPRLLKPVSPEGAPVHGSGFRFVSGRAGSRRR